MGGLKFIPHRHKLLSEVHSSSWLRKGMIVEVKENCRRQVFWDHDKKGEEKPIWVSQGIMAHFSNSVGLGPLSLEAHKPLKDNFS